MQADVGSPCPDACQHGEKLPHPLSPSQGRVAVTYTKSSPLTQEAFAWVPRGWERIWVLMWADPVRMHLPEAPALASTVQQELGALQTCPRAAALRKGAAH